VDDIFRQSRRAFGEEAATRYRLLIAAAFRELTENPERPAARIDVGPTETTWLYHLRHVARRQSGARVASPRHVIAYRFDDSQVRVLRVLHDAMDIHAHLKG
jgi:plasmid stabilization system protein ParE